MNNHNISFNGSGTQKSFIQAVVLKDNRSDKPQSLGRVNTRLKIIK